MKNKRRKPIPSMPHWYWLDQDGCWFCKNKNNCNQCKTNRKYLKKYGEKKIKGKITGGKMTNRDEFEYDR